MKNLLSLLAILISIVSFYSASGINLTAFPVDGSCGNNNARITTEVFGGTGPYSYIWSSGQTTPNISDLAPGVYTVTVTDALAATATTSATVNDLPAITGISASYVVPQPGNLITHPCKNLCDGTAYVNTVYFNGTAPFTISTSLSHSIGFYSPANCPTIEGICTDDNYMVYVTDALGCTGEGYGTFTYPPNSFEFTSQVAAACNSLNNGGIDFNFTNTQGIPYTIFLNGPTTTQGNTNSGQATITSLLPGNYIVIVESDYSQNCDSVFNITVPDAGLNCGTISGKVYADTIQNCIADISEPYVPNRLIQFLPGPYFATSDPLGNYTASLPYGTYTAETVTNNYFSSICSASGINLTVINNSITGIDLGDSTQIELDLSTFLSCGPARPGFIHHMYSSIINHSYTTVSAPEVVINFDPLLTFISSNIPYTVTGPNQVTVQFSSIGSFGISQAHLVFSIPPNPALIGTFLNSYATVNANQPETNLANNYNILEQEITGSFDPNDKAVWPAVNIEHTYLVDVDTAFNYTIRFQNTGNDTAFNVMLVDTLNSYLDLASFQMRGSSHPCHWEITGSNILKIYFDNILLPDSNVNEQGSHGLFSFSIGHTQDLYNAPIPYVLENVAAIYFDFNPPIITNIAFNTVDYSVGIPEINNNDFDIYPNPANESIVISSKDKTNFTRIDIFDLTGRMILQKLPDATTTQVDVSFLSAGTYLITCYNEKGIYRRKMVKY